MSTVLINSEQVAILLSTYNGEKYLAKQIESILNQDYDNFVLYIRDDNSKDGTRVIINDFVRKYDNVFFLNPNDYVNLGVTKSFFYLLKQVNANYYMFSDQDDVWMRDKVSKTLKKMKESEILTKPSLVHTNLYLVDNELDIIGDKIWGDNVSTEFKQLIFTNNVAGCTSMINNVMKNFIIADEDKYDEMFMHDWWIALIASGFGVNAFVKDETMFYRQHADNVVGGVDGVVSRLKRISKIGTEIKRSNKILRQAAAFFDAHSDDLNPSDKKYLSEYANIWHDGSAYKNLLTIIKFPNKKSTLSGKIMLSFFLVILPKKLRSNG
ncbi:glycosyltransferase family 2 protein [Paucilactobacillus nenjiangensis]|uniref:glycosyltransferase family 2 protein n=1 Tax=Paucilactobacillus nenjiangensis TaxID=1296540 RepID=UPI0010F94B5D|nr:glycosyltransferase family 2 protein [Paucilactobacillus nenjiangensis]